VSNGDPVTQKQFADTMRTDKKEVLDAIEKVNGHTQDLRVDVGKVQTSLDTHEKRMDKQDERMDGQDDRIENQKTWNRGLAAIEALLAMLLAWVGIGKE